jgi:hypothetical protein
MIDMLLWNGMDIVFFSNFFFEQVGMNFGFGRWDGLNYWSAGMVR